jgi:hypothetical protein
MWSNAFVVNIRTVGAILAALTVTLWTTSDHASAQSRASTGRLLLATVVDLSGKTLVDFGVDDFVIREGGDEREVLDVHVADYPLVVLIDDAPETNELEPIKAAVARFIARVGDRPVALGTLSRPSDVIAALDDSRDELLARIAKMAPQPGTAATLPAVAHAAHLLHDTGSPFSAIVVVTGRAIDARIPVEGDLLPSINESGAAVHVVESHASQLKAGDADIPDLLRVLSDQTRGQFTTIFTSASYGAALDRLADKLSAELMIQYLVPPGEAGGDVRVGVRRPGARVVGLGVK